MRRIIPAVLALCLGVPTLAGPVAADEGMWTYDHFPKDLVKKRYGFTVTDAWLEHVRLASVRFNSGGSGSFVSATGLVMTNHHVGADCIHKLGASGKNLISDGFLARTPAEEVKCPDLELNVLTAIEDVTADIRSVEKPGMDAAAINKAQKEKMGAIEKACATRTGSRCDVVTLYQGGAFHLYSYRKYTDVRLVFAPEAQIAFFGGDPDNFTYPRFDYDAAFFRAWDGDKPLQPQHFLKWSAKGPEAGKLVFTSGNPGNTSRLSTVAQLEVLRDVSFPARLADLARIHAVLTAHKARGPEEARQAQTPLFGVENGTKAIKGYLAGLQDATLMAAKATAEKALQAKVQGTAWTDIAKAMATWRSMFTRYQQTEATTYGSKLFGIARNLVRMSAEKALPSEQRLREFRDSNLGSVELGLFSPAPIYPVLEEAMLASALAEMQRALGDKDPLVLRVLGGKTPALRARELVQGSKLADVAVRKQLAGDKAALEASQDPLLVLARLLDPEARALRKRYEDEVEGPVKAGQAILAKAGFEAHGWSLYPDATFTLRLSFGQVLGYDDGEVKVPPMTTVGGLYARSDEAKGAHPWDLPKRWQDARGKLDPTVGMNFASTNDIIGGNSGSPVVDQKGEVVGLIFDGNIASLAGNFAYDGRKNRAVSVHSRILIEALRTVYAAPELADELLPLPARKGAKGKPATEAKP